MKIIISINFKYTCLFVQDSLVFTVVCWIRILFSLCDRIFIIKSPDRYEWFNCICIRLHSWFDFQAAIDYYALLGFQSKLYLADIAQIEEGIKFSKIMCTLICTIFGNYERPQSIDKLDSPNLCVILRFGCIC